MAKITKVKRGDTHSIVLNVANAGVAVDLSGYTVFFTVNASNIPTDDSAAVISKTVTLPTPSTPLGQVVITLLPADTTNLIPGTFYYDIQLKDLSGNITSTDQDIFTLVADITRRTS